MKPALPDGCVILIDRNRTRRRDGHIFVVRTEDGLAQAVQGQEGSLDWSVIIQSGNLAWPEDAVIIGEVKWSAVEW